MPDDAEHARHMVMDICQEGNRDRVDAVVAVALDEMGMRLEQALLRPLACEYIVCRVMSDWLSISKPGAAERWQCKARAALAMLGQQAATEVARVSFCRDVPF